MSNNSRQPPRRHMGIEAALEQDRLESLGLDRRHSTSSALGLSSAVPKTIRQSAIATPPVRSLLLDVSPGALPPRHGSIAGIGVGVTAPSPRTWNEPASSPLRLNSSMASSSSATSTSKTFHESGAFEGPPRRSSDNSDHMSIEKKRQVVDKTDAKLGAHIRRNSQTNMSSPSASDHANSSSKRAVQPQEKPPSKAIQSKSGMASVISGLDLPFGLPSFARGRESGRRSLTRGRSLDSRFPSRFGRSSSPKNRVPNANNSANTSSASKPGKLATEKGKEIDMDAAIPNSTGSPASFPKSALRRSTSEADTVPASSQGDERLEKDMYDSENNPIDTSEDEDDTTSSDDEAGSGTENRGRKISFVDLSEFEDTDASKSEAQSETQSLPATDEEEHETIETLEDKLDDITSTSDKRPAATTTTTKTAPPKPAKKPDVHPRTSFEPVSAINTPFGSDDEAELSDIKRAQKLSIQMSTINNSVHNRAIRTIVRGNYSSTQEELEGGRRRQRKYLVATDLSEESVYALEWTIGTILRDGDTMFAVCAVHEEATAGTSVQIGEGAKAMEDAAAVVGSQTEETVQKSQGDASLYLPRALFGRLGPGSESKPSSVDARALSKAESDRVHAAEVISQTCVRLLRKTALQVRIAVEVIHCKSPKHMITEAIDGLVPTLVIVGARGRGALKGVLLGSFSNYLVTNSSVPVMVARKKLKKQSKNKIRLSNNLTTPKKLALAKVD